MKKISIVESIISFQEWIALKFLNRSLLYKPLSTIIKRSKEKFSPNSTSHFTIPKIAKGFIGFIPIGVLSYYLGYTTANKIDFNTFIKYLRSEDEIYSLLDQGKPVLTFMFLPGEVFSETTHIHFHKIAHENYHLLDFVKVNCAEHSAYCRSRKIKHFPTVEIYIPPPLPEASFSEKTRFRLLKGPGNYAICPYHSDFSYEGFKSALQELNLIPTKDPYFCIKSQLQQSFEDSYTLKKSN